MRKTTFALTLVFLVTASPSFGQDDASSDQTRQEAISAATEAAEHWLAVVDSAGWAQSYIDAAEYFKASVAQDVWIRQIRGARMPLGRFKTRAVSDAQYMTSLPGAPDGEYVVISFSASFENKESAVETVTPMKDPDGQWRVSGYYIR